MKHALLIAGLVVVGYVVIRNHRANVARGDGMTPSGVFSGGVNGTASPGLTPSLLSGPECNTCADGTGALLGADRMQALPVRIDGPDAVQGYSHSPLHYH